MLKLLSAVTSLFVWLFVGLLAVHFVSARWATIIGFVAFAVVLVLTSPTPKPKAK